MNSNGLTHIFEWKGRVDGTQSGDLRWHQIVQSAEIGKAAAGNNSWGIIGFPSDEGVRRNNGRIGAAQGPSSIRSACCNFPVHDESLGIFDFGDVNCTGHSLEENQDVLIDAVKGMHLSGFKSLVLGGGHEITYPHFMGLQAAYPGQSIGVINIDAHFDLREIIPDVGSTSGTGFFEIHQKTGSLHCLIIGVQSMANTAVLFSRARQYGVKMIDADLFGIGHTDRIIQSVQDFSKSVDHVYLTLDMDVFAAAFAPGVSAAVHHGIMPGPEFGQIFMAIRDLPNIMAFDIAEVNPGFDIDSRTSRLAAGFIYKWLS